MDAFLERPAWYVIGPVLGLVVVALFATLNQRIGVLGGYTTLLERATGRVPALNWKWWFLVGILGGSLAWRLLAGESTVTDGYGWLSRAFDDGAIVALALFGGGVLIGFGAKTAQGCTAGNGLGGCSLGSVASFSATATFFATAVGATFLFRAIT